MKKLLLAGLLMTTAFCYSFVDDVNSIVGRWEHVFKDGPVNFLVVFKPDGTYDGFANKKAFLNGTYKMKQDTLYIYDPTCNINYAGIYKIEYFGKQDSLKFHVIQDTCRGRREGADGLVYKRLRNTMK
jgi:hypothetical protein